MPDWLPPAAPNARAHVSASNSQDLSQLTAAPPRSAINTGLLPCRPSTLRSLLGEPRKGYGQDCRPPTHPGLKAQIVTASVGPFRVTGHRAAVASLARVMDRIRTEEPEAYRQIGTAGMLCCRLVRGSTRSISNHSWGTAVDLKFNGRLDAMGDGKVQVGLLRVYRFFHAEGWYWGAGFRREDAMHFELADQTVRRLLA